MQKVIGTLLIFTVVAPVLAIVAVVTFKFCEIINIIGDRLKQQLLNKFYERNKE